MISNGSEWAPIKPDRTTIESGDIKLPCLIANEIVPATIEVAAHS